MPSRRPLDPGLSYYKVIKLPLKTVIRHKETLRRLNEVAKNVNKIVIHSYQFIKLLILYLKDNNLPSLVLNRKNILNVMRIVCGRNTVEDTYKIEEFYNDCYRHIQGERPDFTLMTEILDYMVTTIQTMFENNIKQHYIEYVERFVNVLFEKKRIISEINESEPSEVQKKKSISNICANLRAIKNDLLSPSEMKTSNPDFHSFINQHQRFVIPQRLLQKNSVKYDLECSPQDYLQCMIYMMREIELRGEKLMSPFPLRTSSIPKHFQLDAKILIKILFDQKLFKHNKTYYAQTNDISKHYYLIWNTFFKLDMKCFHIDDDYNYKFKYTAFTDGVSISIVLIRRDLPLGERNLKNPEAKKFEETYIDEALREDIEGKTPVAIDPNMGDLIYATNGAERESKRYRYTQDQRRKETKQKKYRDILQRQKINTIVNNKNIIEWETLLSQYNSKTLNFENFRQYVHIKNIINLHLSNFYEQYIFRKMKINVYLNKIKSERRMLKNFEKIFGSPDKVFVAIGDWEQKQHMKFKEPVKGKGFRKLFRSVGYKVFLVDEHRTSCRCSSCEGECKTFRWVSNPRPWKYNMILRHGLVKCDTCTGLWNRDVNASNNIFKIVVSEISGRGRPEYLRRSRRPISDATSALGSEGPS